MAYGFCISGVWQSIGWRVRHVYRGLTKCPQIFAGLNIYFKTEEPLYSLVALQFQLVGTCKAISNTFHNYLWVDGWILSWLKQTWETLHVLLVGAGRAGWFYPATKQQGKKLWDTPGAKETLYLSDTLYQSLARDTSSLMRCYWLYLSLGPWSVHTVRKRHIEETQSSVNIQWTSVVFAQLFRAYKFHRCCHL